MSDPLGIDALQAEFRQRRAEREAAESNNVAETKIEEVKPVEEKPEEKPEERPAESKTDAKPPEESEEKPAEQATE